MSKEETDIFVVLGMDAEGKPHAASFKPEERDAAARAAALMGFHAVRVTDPKQKEVAATLPVGRIFVTGRGFVPFVKRDLYQKLAPLIGTEAEINEAAPAEAAGADAARAGSEAAASEASGSPEPAAAAENAWAALGIGSIVLCADPATRPADDWYAAQVIAVSETGDMLTLKWRDYPYEKNVTVPRRSVGLLPPVQR